MTVGPFDEEVPLGPSEYGGKSGLIQSSVDGHSITASEYLGMLNRVDPDDEDGVDFVTEESVIGIVPE